MERERPAKRPLLIRRSQVRVLAGVLGVAANPRFLSSLVVRRAKESQVVPKAGGRGDRVGGLIVMRDQPVSGHVTRFEGKRRPVWRAKKTDCPTTAQVKKTLGARPDVAPVLDTLRRQVLERDRTQVRRRLRTRAPST